MDPRRQSYGTPDGLSPRLADPKRLGLRQFSTGAGGSRELTPPKAHTPTAQAFAILSPHFTQAAHGGQMGEPIGFKALHAPSLVVHTNQQIFADGFDVGAQSRELRSTLPIAAKQNNAARQRIFEAFLVNRGQCVTFNVNDQRCLDVHSILSTTQ
jgi:hypothetical protein